MALTPGLTEAYVTPRPTIASASLSNPVEGGNASPAVPRRQGGRQRSFQGIFWMAPPGDRALTTEGKSGVEAGKPSLAVKTSAKSSRWLAKTRILYPPETRPSHSADIVVVYMFNSSQGDPKDKDKDKDLTIFQCSQHSRQPEKEPKELPVVRRVEKEQGPDRAAADTSPTTTLLQNTIGFKASDSGADATTTKVALKASSAISPMGRRASVTEGIPPSLSPPRPTESAEDEWPPAPKKKKEKPRKKIRVEEVKEPTPKPDEARITKSKLLPLPPNNWLKDSNMLPNFIPDVRTISVGFDICYNLDSSINFEAMASTLADELDQVRADCPIRPIVLIGHVYGGFVVKQMLIKDTLKDERSKRIIDNTAGVFLVSCPEHGSDLIIEYLANSYGLAEDAKFFENMGTSSRTLTKLTEDFNKKVMVKMNGTKSGPEAQPTRQTTTSRPKGFFLYQFLTSAENSEQRKARRTADRTKPDLSAPRLSDGVPVLVWERDFRNVLKFSSPKDQEFQRLASLVLKAVHTHQLLDASTARPEDMESLVRVKGVNVNLQDRWGQSALHVAIERSNNPLLMVRWLLRKLCADPSPKDSLFNTPLHYAVARNNRSVVQELLDANADVNAVNNNGKTPIDLASRHRHSKRILDALRDQHLNLVKGPTVGEIHSPGYKAGPPLSPEGKLACQGFQVTVTEVLFEGTDYHWSSNLSVQEMIYDPTNLSDILGQFRRKDATGKKLLCRWLHIPENNMIWVEHLLAKLGFKGSIWAGRGHTSQVPHNRAIAPHLTTPRNQNIEERPLAMFVPYLSYEVNKRQAKLSSYIEDEQVDHGFRKRFGISYISNRPTKRESLAEEGIDQAPPLPDQNRGTRENGNFVNIDESAPSFQRDEQEEREPPMSDYDTDAESQSGRLGLNDTGNDEYDLDEEDKALIREYLYDPPSLHVRRTLDQYYYHMIKSTKKRDISQVVTRWAKRKDQKIHNILMVDQLWLWLFKAEDQADIIVSSFPDRVGANSKESRSARSMDKLRDRVLEPIGTTRNPIQTSAGLVLRIFATCSNIFDRCQEVELLQFLQAFETSIGKISDEETSLIGEFKNRSRKLHTLNEKYKHYEDKKKKYLEKLLDIRKETECLVEIKDIMDEINIILTILRAQKSVVGDPRLRQIATQETHGSHYDDALRIVTTSIADFERMQAQAKEVLRSLDTLMDLKQKAANAWEARSAREDAAETTKQGNTMLVFTIVTIIFLPLSFMASFFALNVSSFPQDSKGQTNWPLSLVTAFTFGMSFAVSIPFIFIAFSVRFMSNMWKNLLNDRLIRIPRFLCWILSKVPIQWLRTRCEGWDEYLKIRQGRYKKVKYKKNNNSDIDSDSESSDSDSNTSTTSSSLSRFSIPAKTNFPANYEYSDSDSDDEYLSLYQRARRRLKSSKKGFNEWLV